MNLGEHSSVHSKPQSAQDSWPHSIHRGPGQPRSALLCTHHGFPAGVEPGLLCSSLPGLCTQLVPHKCLM